MPQAQSGRLHGGSGQRTVGAPHSSRARHDLKPCIALSQDFIPRPGVLHSMLPGQNFCSSWPSSLSPISRLARCHPTPTRPSPPVASPSGQTSSCANMCRKSSLGADLPSAPSTAMPVDGLTSGLQLQGGTRAINLEVYRIFLKKDTCL